MTKEDEIAPVTRPEPLVCRVVCFNEEKVRALEARLPAAGELEAAARRHKALGHPGRMAILHVLAMEECCVCDLANVLRQPVSTVSQNLRILRAAGLVRSRQEGKLVFCSLAPEEARASAMTSPAERTG